MNKIRKGDTIQVTKGKDKGKKGKVLNVFTNGKILVENINLAKKHKRQTSQDQKGGIIQIEAPINQANVKLVCKGCNQPVRIGFKLMDKGGKERICKKCKGVI